MKRIAPYSSSTALDQSEGTLRSAPLKEFTGAQLDRAASKGLENILKFGKL